MPQWDMPIQQLRRYRPELTVPEDLETFWSSTLERSRARSWPATFTEVDNGLALVQTFDVTFAGYEGEPIKGWLHLPTGAATPLPTVVQYLGYNSGRSLPHEVPVWTLAGHGTFVMDTRGQGWNLYPGDTPDLHGNQVAYPGMMTRGIESPETYYYRRVYADAALAVDAARSHPLVDDERILLAGGSQGGGICIAASALTTGTIGSMPDVPFLCDFPRSTTVIGVRPYDEIVQFLASHRGLVDVAFRTLAYFDAVTLAAWAGSPALFSVGLMDEICAPSSIYAAYNAWAGPKEIVEYPFNAHEGGGAQHTRVKLDWAVSRLSSL